MGAKNWWRSFIVLGVTIGLTQFGLAQEATWKKLLAEKPPFSLPQLPYAYKDLEPAIDETTMTIHHQRHHQAYLTKANEILEQEKKTSSVNELFSTLVHELPALKNQLGGHVNHSFFWTLFSAQGKEMPKRLKKEIEKRFVNEAAFKEEFEKKATGLFGSGWVWLVRDAKTKSLEIVTTSNQDNPLMQKEIAHRQWPIFGVDVWEHAYYLKYQNKRLDYVKSLWSKVNWVQVDRYDQEVVKFIK